MTRRSVPRRVAPWLTVAFPLVMLPTCVGCHRLPLRRLDSELDPRQAGPVRLTDAEALAANIVTEPVSHPPTLPPLPTTRGEPTERHLADRCTPYLDAALERAQALQNVTADPHPSRDLLPITRDDDPESVPTTVPVEAPPILEPPAPFIVPAALAGPSSVEDEDTADALDARDHVNRSSEDSIAGGAVEETGIDPPGRSSRGTRERGPSEPAPSRAADDATTLPPVMDWKEQLVALRDLATREAERGGEGAEDWKYRAVLLDEILQEALAGGEADSPVMASVLAMLAESSAMVESRTRDETSDGSDAPVIAQTPTEASLSVGALEFCREVRGYGDFVAEPSSRFLPGQVVILYCEMNGVQYEPVNPDYRSRLASSVELVTADGETPVWSRTLGVAEDLCRRPRRDYYVSYQFALPPADKVAPGAYLLVLRQVDRVSGQTCEGELPIVLGRP